MQRQTDLKAEDRTICRLVANEDIPGFQAIAPEFADSAEPDPSHGTRKDLLAY